MNTPRPLPSGGRVFEKYTEDQAREERGRFHGGSTANIKDHYCKHCGIARVKPSGVVVPDSGGPQNTTCLPEREGHEWVSRPAHQLK
jgi:hypothetical protein